jgi:uncharacterized membrane protein YedE/YeeE
MPLIETLFPLGSHPSIVGGLVIGLAVSFVCLPTGLMGGISTFFTSTLSFISNWPYFQRDEIVSSRNWRLAYAAGLIVGASIWLFTVGEPFQTEVSWWQLSLGGFIAGFGARLSNGCTSGHGICGIASLQIPSFLSVIIFLASAMIAAAVVKMLGGV